MKYLIITLFILAGCQTEPKDAARRCIKTSIDGVECVYCEFMAKDIAISCNWNKES